MSARFKVKLSNGLSDTYGQSLAALNVDLVVWDFTHNEWVIGGSVRDLDSLIETCNEWNEENKRETSLRLVK